MCTSVWTPSSSSLLWRLWVLWISFWRIPRLIPLSPTFWYIPRTGRIWRIRSGVLSFPTFLSSISAASWVTKKRQRWPSLARDMAFGYQRSPRPSRTLTTSSWSWVLRPKFDPILTKVLSSKSIFTHCTTQSNRSWLHHTLALRDNHYSPIGELPIFLSAPSAPTLPPVATSAAAATPAAAAAAAAAAFRCCCRRLCRCRCRSQWRSILMLMGGGGTNPSVVFKQNSYFTYFMKLFWSCATHKATNHFRKDPVFWNGSCSVCCSTVLEEYFSAVPRPTVPPKQRSHQPSLTLPPKLCTATSW